MALPDEAAAERRRTFYNTIINVPAVISNVPIVRLDGIKDMIT